MQLSNEVKQDIIRLIQNIEITTPLDISSDCCSLDKDCDCDDNCHSMIITIATNTGDEWNYQTGDNSYTGGCYSLQHWAVSSIAHGDNREQFANELIEQLNDTLAMQD